MSSTRATKVVLTLMVLCFAAMRGWGPLHAGAGSDLYKALLFKQLYGKCDASPNTPRENSEQPLLGVSRFMAQPLVYTEFWRETFGGLLYDFLKGLFGSMRVQATCLPTRPFVDVHRFGPGYIVVVPATTLDETQMVRFRAIVEEHAKRMLKVSPLDDEAPRDYCIVFASGGLDRVRGDKILTALFKEVLGVEKDGELAVFLQGQMNVAFDPN